MAQKTPTKLQLSPARQKLVELFQKVDFGRLKKVRIRGGEPTFDRPPRVVRELKLGGERSRRSSSGPEDYQLKQELVDFFTYLDAMPDGEIAVVEVRHGLPFRVILKEDDL